MGWLSGGAAEEKTNPKLWTLPYRLQLKQEREERLSLLNKDDDTQPCCTQSFFLLLFISLLLALGVGLAIAGYKHFSTEVGAHHSFVQTQCVILHKAVERVDDCFRGVCEEGYLAKLLVEFQHRYNGRQAAWAHEKVSKPRHPSELHAWLLLDTFPTSLEDSRNMSTTTAKANSTAACFYNRKDASEVVMSVDYDTSFVVSLVLWIFIILYILGASAIAFIYVTIKKAKARSKFSRIQALPISTRDDGGAGIEQHDNHDGFDSSEDDENVCEEDPIFEIYDYGTFRPHHHRNPRSAVHADNDTTAV